MEKIKLSITEAIRTGERCTEKLNKIADEWVRLLKSHPRRDIPIKLLIPLHRRHAGQDVEPLWPDTLDGPDAAVVNTLRRSDRLMLCVANLRKQKRGQTGVKKLANDPYLDGHDEIFDHEYLNNILDCDSPGRVEKYPIVKVHNEFTRLLSWRIDRYSKHQGYNCPVIMEKSEFISLDVPLFPNCPVGETYTLPLLRGEFVQAEHRFQTIALLVIPKKVGTILDYEASVSAAAESVLSASVCGRTAFVADALDAFFIHLERDGCVVYVIVVKMLRAATNIRSAEHIVRFLRVLSVGVCRQNFKVYSPYLFSHKFCKLCSKRCNDAYGGMLSVTAGRAIYDVLFLCLNGTWENKISKEIVDMHIPAVISETPAFQLSFLAHFARHLEMRSAPRSQEFRDQCDKLARKVSAVVASKCSLETALRDQHVVNLAKKSDKSILMRLLKDMTNLPEPNTTNLGAFLASDFVHLVQQAPRKPTALYWPVLHRVMDHISVQKEPGFSYFWSNKLLFSVIVNAWENALECIEDSSAEAQERQKAVSLAEKMADICCSYPSDTLSSRLISRKTREMVKNKTYSIPLVAKIVHIRVEILKRRVESLQHELTNKKSWMFQHARMPDEILREFMHSPTRYIRYGGDGSFGSLDQLEDFLDEHFPPDEAYRGFVGPVLWDCNRKIGSNDSTSSEPPLSLEETTHGVMTRIGGRGLRLFVDIWKTHADRKLQMFSYRKTEEELAELEQWLRFNEI